VAADEFFPLSVEDWAKLIDARCLA